MTCPTRSRLALIVALVAVWVGIAAAETQLDSFKTQVANDLLTLEQRVHNKHNEAVQSVLQEFSKLKKSVESSSKGSELDNIRKQLDKIQTELTATKEKLEKTNEKIRQLQAENLSFKETLDSLKDQSFSAHWKAWREYLGSKWHSVMGNTATFVDAASSGAAKFTDFAKTKSTWLMEQWHYLYDNYFQYAVPVVVTTSEKAWTWAQETHQKWRPTLDQQIHKLHALIQQHPKLAELQLEKFITVESVAAVLVVFASVLLRLLLPLCCRRSKPATKPIQNPSKF